MIRSPANARTAACCCPPPPLLVRCPCPACPLAGGSGRSPAYISIHTPRQRTYIHDTPHAGLLELQLSQRRKELEAEEAVGARARLHICLLQAQEALSDALQQSALPPGAARPDCEAGDAVDAAVERVARLMRRGCGGRPGFGGHGGGRTADTTGSRAATGTSPNSGGSASLDSSAGAAAGAASRGAGGDGGGSREATDEEGGREEEDFVPGAIGLRASAFFEMCVRVRCA